MSKNRYIIGTLSWCIFWERDIFSSSSFRLSSLNSFRNSIISEADDFDDLRFFFCGGVLRGSSSSSSVVRMICCPWFHRRNGGCWYNLWARSEKLYRFSLKFTFLSIISRTIVVLCDFLVFLFKLLPLIRALFASNFYGGSRIELICNSLPGDVFPYLFFRKQAVILRK